MSREYTEEEVITELLEHISTFRDYWLRQKNVSERDRFNGLIHSILCIFDGYTALPAFDIAVKPAPEDKQYHIENGDNYYPTEGEVINERHLLHNLWVKYR